MYTCTCIKVACSSQNISLIIHSLSLYICINVHMISFRFCFDGPFQFCNCFSPGPGCSKLKILLVNDSLKFQTSVSQIRQYFLLKKCEKLLQCSAKASLIFSTKISVNLEIKW